MTVANDWADMMPHRIKVTSTKPNDYGKPGIIAGSERTYMCLIDDSTSTVRNVGGDEVTVALTAYTWPVPVDSSDGAPRDIEDTDKVEILSPRPQTRTLTAVDRHYDETGILHNLTLRFS